MTKISFRRADTRDWYTAQEMLEIGLYEQAYAGGRDAIEEYTRSFARHAGCAIPSCRARFFRFILLASWGYGSGSRKLCRRAAGNPGNGHACYPPD
jgi:hypothetical protein